MRQIRSAAARGRQVAPVRTRPGWSLPEMTRCFRPRQIVDAMRREEALTLVAAGLRPDQVQTNRGELNALAKATTGRKGQFRSSHTAHVDDGGGWHVVPPRLPRSPKPRLRPIPRSQHNEQAHHGEAARPDR